MLILRQMTAPLATPLLGAVLLCLTGAAPVAQAADPAPEPAEGMGWISGRLFGGFRLAEPEWSLEADRVDFGAEPAAAGTGPDAVQPGDRYALRGFSLSGTGSLPLNHGLSLFGKVGVLGRRDPAWYGGVNTSPQLDVTYGAGGEYDFGEGLSLRAGWDRYSLEQQGDDDLFSAGIRYQFK